MWLGWIKLKMLALNNKNGCVVKVNFESALKIEKVLRHSS